MKAIITCKIFVFHFCWCSVTCASLYFTIEPNDHITPLGSTVNFNCQAKSDEPNSNILINWQFNNTYITDYKKSNYHLLNNNTLQIKSVARGDQGFYQCSAISIVSSVQREEKISRVASLKLPSIGPSFLFSSKPISAHIGSTVHLQCISPTCIPLCTIQWIFNGLMIQQFNNKSMILDGRQSSTLEIKNFTLASEGTYKCVAKNPLSNEKVESDEMLVSVQAVKQEPYFHLKPSALVTPRYKSALLHCAVLGIPRPSVKWFRDNKTVSNDSSHRILWNGTLYFTNVELADVGKYFCEGENEHGAIVSYPPVPLFVTYIEFQFKRSPSNQVIISGHPFSLHCTPPDSYPKNLLIKWYFNYNPIQIEENHSVTLSNNGTIKFHKASLQNDGLYFCEAVNPISNIARTSQLAVITIHAPPVLSKQKKIIAVELNKSILLYCNASGVPFPNTTLFKVENKSLVVLSQNGRHLILSARKTNGGLYKCEAINEIGMDEYSFHLDIQYSPLLITKPKNITITLHQALNITCNATGNPMPVFLWKFHFNSSLVNISSSKQCSLNFTDINQRKEGFHTVTALNAIGQDSVTFYLQILVPPTIKLSGTTTANQTYSATLHCITTGDPPPHVLWYFENERIDFKTNASKYMIQNTVEDTSTKDFYVSSLMVIKNISRKDEGRYFCVANNTIGMSNQSFDMIVQVPPVITKYRIDVIFTNNGSMEIYCHSYSKPLSMLYVKHNGTNIVSDQPSTLNLTLTKLTLNQSGQYECCAENILGLVCSKRNIVILVPPFQVTNVNIVSRHKNSLNVIWDKPFDGNSHIHEYHIVINSDVSFVCPNETCLVINLRPFTNYSIQVKAINDIGAGLRSQPIHSRTLQAAPSKPESLRMLSKAHSSLIVSWNKPTHGNGIIVYYRIVVTQHQDVINVYNLSSTRNDNLNNFTFKINYLTPYTTYGVKVQAVNQENEIYLYGEFSKQILETTQKAVPVIKVRNLRIENVTSRGFLITYNFMNNQNGLNGELKGFKIQVKTEQGDVINIKTEDKQFEVKNLRPFQHYHISVAVENDIGVGPFSQQISIITLQDVPGRVSNMSFKQLNNSAMKFTWNAPGKTNGKITGYKIELFDGSNVTVYRYFIDQRTDHIIENLQVNRTYFIQIAAQTIVGFGNYSEAIPFVLVLKESNKTREEASSVKTWTEKEYLIIIIGVSAFSIILLFIIVLLIISKCCSRKKNQKDNSHNRSLEMASSPTKPRGRTNSSLNDFIWESSSNDNFILQAEPVVTYETVKPPTPPRAPISPKSVVLDSDNKTNSSRSNTEVFGYQSVDPYQGRTVEMSPLVRLNGKEKKTVSIHRNDKKVYLEADVNYGFSTDGGPFENFNPHSYANLGINSRNKRNSISSSSISDDEIKEVLDYLKMS